MIETPKASRAKFKYEPDLGLFKVDKFLPAGAVFPFDFGFVPSTLADDGDPVDVLVLTDGPVCTGCLVPARLIGVIEAEEKEEGRTERNDRLVAVAVTSLDHSDVLHMNDLGPRLIREIEYFFSSYNQFEGKVFRSLGTFGPKRAEKVVKQGVHALKSSKKKQAKGQDNKVSAAAFKGDQDPW